MPQLLVRCRAEFRYPQDPTAWYWEGRWVQARQVLDRQRTPQGWVFRVLGDDNQEYRLVYDAAADRWEGERLSGWHHPPKTASPPEVQA